MIGLGIIVLIALAACAIAERDELKDLPQDFS
jgi:hypothetical protein